MFRSLPLAALLGTAVLSPAMAATGAGHDAPAATTAAPASSDRHTAATGQSTPLPYAPSAQPVTAAVPRVDAGPLCAGFGPQTPRDIRSGFGANPVAFALAPESTAMNLCNIHTHTSAEHAGPGFSISVGTGENGGYMCNGTTALTLAELEPVQGDAAFHGVQPGNTIEVHWVYSSCPVAPGQGLGSCMSDTCKNPELRVESQVFLVVNDPNALDIRDFDYTGSVAPSGRHQPRALPTGTGTPVVFMGSTTGTSYTQSICSPFQVTWSVRPDCAKIDVNSLHAWAAAGNAFNETHSHGVRQLVTAPELLAPIK